MIIGKCVLTPCPTSGFFAMIVTAPSARDADKRAWAYDAGAVPALPACAKSFASGST